MAELGIFGVGVATADSELREVGQNKTSVCSVNLAFNRSYKNKNDEWKDEVCFVRAQVWGPRAKRMAELVKKGQPIYIVGYLKMDSWEDDDGKKRVSYSMTLRDFQLCQKMTKKKSNDEENAKVGASNTSESGPPVGDDDIPF